MILRNKRATLRIYDEAKNKAKRSLDAFVSENLTYKVESFEPGLFPAAISKPWGRFLPLHCSTSVVYNNCTKFTHKITRILFYFKMGFYLRVQPVEVPPWQQYH